jgi:hypothetical protein
MKENILVLSLLGFILCLSGITAQAQDTGKISLFGGYSLLSNNWGNGCFGACFGGGTAELHGYSASADYFFNNHVGLEANFSGHNGSPVFVSVQAVGTNNGTTDVESQDLYTLTFGPKLALPVGNFSLFTHFLVGVAHGHEGLTSTCIQATSGPTCGTPSGSSARGTGFAYKTGAGVDWNHGHWGIRILEVDYVHPSIFVTESNTCCTQLQSFDIAGNNFELSTGVTFNFGGK